MTKIICTDTTCKYNSQKGKELKFLWKEGWKPTPLCTKKLVVLDTGNGDLYCDTRKGMFQ